MIDLAQSGLTQVVWFELLDLNRRSLNLLDGVRSMTRERNQYATPSTSGQIDITLKEDVDLIRSSIRQWVTLSDGVEEEHYPLFTGIPFLSGQERTRASARVSAKLLDFTRLLDVPIGHNYTVVPGELVTARIRQLLQSVGALDASITESSGTVGTPMYWAPTDTKRRIVNDLLEAIGYRAVWADEWGRLRCEPYVRPSARPVIEDLGLIHGQSCTYMPEFTVDHDVSDVPNHAIVTPRMALDLEPVVGEAWLPSSHPYSFQIRQIEIPYSEAEVEIALAIPGNPTKVEDVSPAVLASYRDQMKAKADEYALRKLLERASPSRSLTVQNRWRPCNIQDVTRFVAPARGTVPAIDTTVTIVKDTTTYQAGGTLKVTTTVQEVMS